MNFETNNGLSGLTDDELLSYVNSMCYDVHKEYKKNFKSTLAQLKEERWNKLLTLIPLDVIEKLGITKEIPIPNTRNVSSYLSKAERERDEVISFFSAKRRKPDVSLNNILDSGYPPPFDNTEDITKSKGKEKLGSFTGNSYSLGSDSYTEGKTFVEHTTESEDYKFKLFPSKDPTREYCRGTTPPGDFFYQLRTTQFKENATTACTAIAFVCAFYTHGKESREDIVNSIDWKEIFSSGINLWDLWKSSLDVSTTNNYSDVNDIISLEGTQSLIDDIGGIEEVRGPLYYEQTLYHTEEEKKYFGRPLIQELKQLRVFSDDHKFNNRVAVLISNGYSISLWTNKDITMIFDTHGMRVTGNNASVDFIQDIGTVYKRCLKLTRSSLYWKGKGGNVFSDQYSMMKST